MKTILIHQDKPEVPGCDEVLEDIYDFIDMSESESDLQNLIVIHGNNEDGIQTIPEGWKTKWEGIASANSRLEFLGLNVCRSNGRLIVVSEGSFNPHVTEMIESLERRLDVSETHYHQVENFNFTDRIDWERARRTNLPSEVYARDFIRGSAKTYNYLAALSVLCQGYVAVMSMQEDDSCKSDEIRECLDLMGWNAFMQEPQNKSFRESLSSKMDEVQRAEWWLTVLGEDQGFAEAIEDEWGDDFDSSGLGELITLLNAKYRVTPFAVGQACVALHNRLSRG